MASRPTSPSLFSRTFAFSNGGNDDPSRRTSKQQQQDTAPRSRTSSLPPHSPVPDPFTAHPSGSSSFVTYESSALPTLVSGRASTSHAHDSGSSMLASLPKRARGSLLLSFGRPRTSAGKGRAKTSPPPPAPFMFSEVIEITGSTSPQRTSEEDEDAERERLRDAAAQSIGLGSDLLEERSTGSITEESAEHDLDELAFDGEMLRTSMTTPTLAPSQSQSIIIPPFPATRAALDPFVIMHSRFPKHHPPPSLLRLALARQWKTRVLVLTSSPPLAFLHIFKNTSAEERELERLEIGADSRVFVVEAEVGGRRGVVRVAQGFASHSDLALGKGKDKDQGQVHGKEREKEMTFHIVDPSEAQKWITIIKQAVLSQRSVRAGLGMMSSSPNGTEPRGDLDVILSMRAQGMIPSPTTSTFPSSSPSSPTPVASSSASQRSTSGTRSPTGAVSALRGLFSGSGTRPRSPSTVSIRTSNGEDDDGEETAREDSFGRAGTSLLSMLRVNPNATERPTSPTSVAMSVPGMSPSTPSTPRQAESQQMAHLDRKILQDEDIVLVEAQSRGLSSSIHAPGNVTDSLLHRNLSSASALRGTSSLQPPPRRRAWTASGGSGPAGPRSRPESAYAYTHANASTADSFGLRPPHSAAGSFLFAANPPSSSPPQASIDIRPRTSLSSTSSFGSGEPRTSNEIGNGNGSGNPKRWSRQSALVTRLTPPDGSGSPPASHGSPGSWRSSVSMGRHPYAAGASSSPGPSRPQSAQSSPQSFILNLREYSKRASGSSVRSTSSVSTTQSRATNGNGNGSFIGHHRPRSSHRTSMPPPQRPAPISALPPTPGEETTRPKTPNSAPANKTSFRESLSLRTHRLSLSPPTLPPSSVLPPRPDEASFRSHRRSSSIGSGSASLAPIPASPTPLNPPYPPPSGPLPPTPEIQTRSASLVQRFRKSSVPAPPPYSNPPPHPPSPVPSTINPYSVPSTPLGEPITTLQNDPAFLFSVPPTPPPPRSTVRPPSPEPSTEWQGVTSLSPPPRRGSRRISVQDRDDPHEHSEPRPSTGDTAGTDVSPLRISISLSPPTSAVSLVKV